MAAQGEDDLSVEQTEGFKVGEKKTIDEYQKLGERLGLHLSCSVLILDQTRTMSPSANGRSRWVSVQGIP